MTTVTVPLTETIAEGQTFISYSMKKKLQTGERVNIARALGALVGKPIATGVVTRRMRDDARSVLRPTSAGKRKKNVWRDYYEIEVKEIF